MPKDKHKPEIDEQQLDSGHKREHGGDHGAAHDSSEHQRKAPEAGVRTDTRWGDDKEEMFDIHGRILGISIVDGGTELMIGAGRDQGVHQGMTGYLMAGDTYFAQLDIVGVDKRVCRVKVDATPDAVRAHQDNVRINPSSTPARASQAVHDYKTRVIKVDIIDGRPRISLAGGSAHGVQAGMEGVLLDDSGKRIVSFKLDEIHSRFATAMVDTILSEVQRSSSAIIAPTH